MHISVSGAGDNPTPVVSIHENDTTVSVANSDDSCSQLIPRCTMCCRVQQPAGKPHRTYDIGSKLI